MKKAVYSLFAAVIAITLIGFASCNDKEEKEQPVNNGRLRAEYTYLGDINEPALTPIEFSYHLDGNTLTIEKKNHRCNTIADNPRITTEIHNDTIIVMEEWYNGGFDGDFVFNADSRDINLTVYDLPKGDWVVVNISVTYRSDGNTNNRFIRGVSSDGQLLIGDGIRFRSGNAFHISVK